MDLDAKIRQYTAQKFRQQLESLHPAEFYVTGEIEHKDFKELITFIKRNDMYTIESTDNKE